MYIVSRKGAVAVVALMFRDNPAFQFSLTVLILFVAFVGAVKHRPYMSTMERRHEVANHLAKVASEDKFHLKVDNMIKSALQKEAWEQSTGNRRSQKIRFDGSGSVNVSTSNTKKLQQKKKKNETKVYFFDYNTVERVLLASSILIALAGIMFESGRFDERADLLWQRDTIAVLVIIVVVFSICYYLVVFSAEVMGATPEWLVRLCSEKKRPVSTTSGLGSGAGGFGSGNLLPGSGNDGGFGDMEM